MQIDNNSQKTDISLDEANAWKQEAEAIGRSSSHLEKIDLTINNAEKTQIDNEPAISLEQKDALALKKDREDFQKVELEKQNQIKAPEISQSKGMRR
jgi:hypothetical protein